MNNLYNTSNTPKTRFNDLPLMNLSCCLVFVCTIFWTTTYVSKYKFSIYAYSVNSMNIIFWNKLSVCTYQSFNQVLTKQSLSDVCKRPLDETLCIQYQNMLLEKIVKENRLEEVTYILYIIVLILSLNY